MPYNLRKRKAPEEDTVKKTKLTTKTAKTTKTSRTTKTPVTAHTTSPKTTTTTSTTTSKTPTATTTTKKAPISATTVKIAPTTTTTLKTSTTTTKVPSITTTNQLIFGDDTCGELGLKKIGITREKPTPVSIDELVEQVSCGPMHTLSLTKSGKVYSYGCNDEGALGRITDGDETLEATPALVPIKGKVIKVSTGDSHSAALTDENEVFIWGNFRDEHGSIGISPDCDGKATFTPIQVMAGTNFKDVASGSNHMLLLDTDGVVYSFGVGAQGQLGRLKPEDIGDHKEPRAITAKNRELFLKPQSVCLKNVDPQRPFVCDAIYAGNFSSFATNTDKKKNRLAGWGLNNYFQLGYKGQKGQLIQHYPRRSTFTCSTSMINVACGQHHTLFLTKTGRVYSAGRHEYGMLGLGEVTKEVCPAKFIESLGNTITTVSVGINTSFAVSDDGKLYSWGMSGSNLGVGGDDDLMVPTEIKRLADKKVLSVSTGGSFTTVLVE